MIETVEKLNNFAKNNSLEIIAIEQCPNSISLSKFQSDCNEDKKKKSIWNDKIVVFGNEVAGIRREILEMAKYIVEIPRIGKHNSLNITTVCGIVLDKVVNYPN